MAESERARRVATRIRAELMELFLRGDVKDPGARGAIVHDVRVTADLQHARVYVRLSEPEPSEGRRQALLRALGRAGGFLRREVGRRVGLRHAPELRFEWDDTAEKARRVEHLLEEVRRGDREEER